jgi:epoxyqueuosine reductase
LLSRDGFEAMRTEAIAGEIDESVREEWRTAS